MSDRIGAPMQVVRVETNTGSHIEPELRTTWSHFEQLRWMAGVALADGGITVDVVDAGKGQYGLIVLTPDGPIGMSTRNFWDAWRAIGDMAMGAKVRGQIEATQ